MDNMRKIFIEKRVYKDRVEFMINLGSKMDKNLKINETTYLSKFEYYLSGGYRTLVWTARHPKGLKKLFGWTYEKEVLKQYKLCNKTLLKYKIEEECSEPIEVTKHQETNIE
jgi:hypothetical protein